jgi:hypothetical protein
MEKINKVPGKSAPSIKEPAGEALETAKLALSELENAVNEFVSDPNEMTNLSKDNQIRNLNTRFTEALRILEEKMTPKARFGEPPVSTATKTLVETFKTTVGPITASSKVAQSVFSLKVLTTQFAETLDTWRQYPVTSTRIEALRRDVEILRLKVDEAKELFRLIENDAVNTALSEAVEAATEFIEAAEANLQRATPVTPRTSIGHDIARVANAAVANMIARQSENNTQELSASIQAAQALVDEAKEAAADPSATQDVKNAAANLEAYIYLFKLQSAHAYIQQSLDELNGLPRGSRTAQSKDLKKVAKKVLLLLDNYQVFASSLQLPDAKVELETQIAATRASAQEAFNISDEYEKEVATKIALDIASINQLSNELEALIAKLSDIEQAASILETAKVLHQSVRKAMSGLSVDPVVSTEAQEASLKANKALVNLEAIITACKASLAAKNVGLVGDADLPNAKQKASSAAEAAALILSENRISDTRVKKAIEDAVRAVATAVTAADGRRTPITIQTKNEIKSLEDRIRDAENTDIGPQGNLTVKIVRRDCVTRWNNFVAVQNNQKKKQIAYVNEIVECIGPRETKPDATNLQKLKDFISSPNARDEPERSLLQLACDILESR